MEKTKIIEKYIFLENMVNIINGVYLRKLCSIESKKLEGEFSGYEAEEQQEKLLELNDKLEDAIFEISDFVKSNPSLKLLIEYYKLIPQYKSKKYLVKKVGNTEIGSFVEDEEITNRIIELEQEEIVIEYNKILNGKTRKVKQRQNY